MSEFTMALDALAATVAKGLTVFCLCAMALIVAREFGRGTESLWPPLEEAPEPPTADVPRSSELRDVDASVRAEGGNSAVWAQ